VANIVTTNILLSSCLPRDVMQLQDTCAIVFLSVTLTICIKLAELSLSSSLTIIFSFTQYHSKMDYSQRGVRYMTLCGVKDFGFFRLNFTSHVCCNFLSISCKHIAA